MKFTDALDRKLEEVKRPPNLPTGHYVWQINKVPDREEFDSSRTGKTFDRITFQLTCVEAMDDVKPLQVVQTAGKMTLTDTFDKKLSGLINHDRMTDYGHPLDHFKISAQIKTAIFSCPDAELRHALEMIADKMARLCH